MSVSDPLRAGGRRSLNSGGVVPAIMQELHGKMLWTSLDFWLLFVIMSLGTFSAAPCLTIVDRVDTGSIYVIYS